MVSLLVLADQASRHTNHNVTRPVLAGNRPAPGPEPMGQ